MCKYLFVIARRNDEAISYTVRAKNITQEQLAFDTGLELSQIGRIERGVINTSITSVFEIAKALNIEPIELWRF
jgi:transcriptional regulator with XRE-family HTH domain